MSSAVSFQFNQLDWAPVDRLENDHKVARPAAASAAQLTARIDVKRID